MFNISRPSPGFSKATFCGSSQVPRDASAVAVPGFCCFSGPDASDLLKQTGTKMPFFQVPSSGNDSAEMAKLQNPLFQRTLKDDPHFETQVKALERMLKVRERVVESDAAVSGATSGKSVAGHASGADGRPNFAGLRVGSKKFAAAGVFNGNSGFPDGPVSALSKMSSVAELETSAGVRGSAAVTTADEFADLVSCCAPDATAGRSSPAHATAGESDSSFGFCCLSEIEFPSLNSSGCAAAVACARWPAAASSSSFSPAPGCSSFAVSAVVAHARFTPMHDAHNSCSDTAINSLRVQRATSYNPQGVVAHNSRRKVRLSSTVGSRSVVQTVDMSPAPAAGTYRRSADKVHDQRQVSRKRLAESSGGGPGPGPGSGR